jgi:hypothetical protein
MGSKASKTDGEWLALAPLSATAACASAAISTTDACVQLAPGCYLVYVKGTASSSVDEYALKFGAANTVQAAFPSDTADNATPTMTDDTVVLPCQAPPERVVVSSAKPFVSFVLSSGGTATKIRFVRV